MEGRVGFNHIAMTNAVTAGEMLSISSSLLQDMQVFTRRTSDAVCSWESGSFVLDGLRGHVVSGAELNRDTRDSGVGVLRSDLESGGSRFLRGVPRTKCAADWRTARAVTAPTATDLRSDGVRRVGLLKELVE